LFHNITFGAFADAPHRAGNITKWYRALSRGSRNFALLSDVTVALLGGALKMRQRTSGRLADALSELYFISSILKRYEDDGQITSDLVLVEYSVQNALARFYGALDEVLENYPSPVMGFLLRRLVFPFGNHHKPAKDRLGKAIVKKTLNEEDTRNRLTSGVYISRDETDATGILEVTLQEIKELAPVSKKLETAIKNGQVRRFHGADWFQEAVEKGVLSDNEANRLKRLEALTAKVIAVDQFDPKTVQGVTKSTGHNAAHEHVE